MRCVESRVLVAMYRMRTYLFNIWCLIFFYRNWYTIDRVRKYEKNKKYLSKKGEKKLLVNIIKLHMSLTKPVDQIVNYTPNRMITLKNGGVSVGVRVRRRDQRCI